MLPVLQRGSRVAIKGHTHVFTGLTKLQHSGVGEVFIKHRMRGNTWLRAPSKHSDLGPSWGDAESISTVPKLLTGDLEH
jgi:hypothetical protein